MKRYIICLFAVMCIAFTGCQSLQRDLMLSVADERVFRELAEIEENIVRLEAAGQASQAELANVRRLIAALEGTVADTHFQAILTAYSGRLFVMEGRNSNAQRELRRSQNLSTRNVPSVILSFRLERNIARRLSLIEESLQTHGSLGELLIERGRVLFDLSRFAESVAAFDAAFVLLHERPFYEEIFTPLRNSAWQLRGVEDRTADRIVDIVRRSEITWRDAIELTRHETQLLRFITAGRDWSAETIFSHLVDRAFIPLTQDTELTEWPPVRPSPNDLVLRSGAAWFLWHLHAENRANRNLLTRYSLRFAAMPDPRSPIPDISISSPFLDSVLGCVGARFMSLPDGRHFMPSEPVRGSEFLPMLRRLPP